MKYRFLRMFLPVMIVVFVTSECIAVLQSNRQLETIARFTAAIISQKHYSQQVLDDTVSSKLFDEYFRTLDPGRLFFTRKDIDSFERFRHSLDDQLAAGRVDFAFEVYNKYIENYLAYCAFAKELVENGIDFSSDETFEVDRGKASWPADEREMRELWRKRTMNVILTFALMDKAAEHERAKLKEKAAESGQEPAAAPWKTRTPKERFIMRLDQTVAELQSAEPLEVLTTYLSSLTRVYDPHSSYMSPRQEDSFNIAMQLSLVGIGAVLSSDDCYTKIVKIIPGGPADRDNRLRPEDRIVAVCQDGSEPVDVIGMPLDKVVEMIRGKDGTRVHLSILPAAKGQSAVPETITIVRGKVELKEQEASGRIERLPAPDGEIKKIGIITLPSFYMDFAEASRGNRDYKSSTNDVARIIREFNNEGIDGLILDMRSNGGGSLVEAIRLTGLFIEGGPVVQIKDGIGRISVKNDEDPNMHYKGPLVLLVNKLSASAAEIFAGAIKDYKRGLIVGDSHTHGKGTVQTVYQLKDLLSIFGVDFKAGSIKFTNAKFYRINGYSTQLKGVDSHISFPSFTDAMKIGEIDLNNPMAWDAIKAVDYNEYQPDLDKIVELLKARSDERIRENPRFTALEEDIESFKRLNEKKVVSLNKEKRWEEYLNERKYQEQRSLLLRLNSQTEDGSAPDADNPEAPGDTATAASKDLYLEETENILLDYIVLQSRPESDRDAAAFKKLPARTTAKKHL